MTRYVLWGILLTKEYNMKTNKDIVAEMEELLSQLKGYKKIYESCEDRAEQFISNYVQITDDIKTKLMSLSSELVSDNQK